MTKIMPIILLSIFAITGIVFAQTMTTRIDSLNVNFDQQTATLTSQSGYYDNAQSWHPTGATSQTTITEPAFDSILNELAQQNAFNLNTMEQVLKNSV